MKRLARGAALAALALGLLAAPPQAHAESFLEAYAGAALTLDDDIRADATGPGLNLDFTIKGTDFQETAIFGGRGGIWFERAPNWGFAVDLFYFSPDIDSQSATVTSSGTGTVGSFVNIPALATTTTVRSVNIGVFALSWDLMGRIPLQTSEAYPRGRLQPYALAGPALFFADVEGGDTDTVFGLKAGAGMRWAITKQFGIFVEYRFTHFKPELSFDTGGVDVRLDNEFNTHAVMAGVSIRF